MAEAKRDHRATYSRDNRNGGYIIRVEGPKCNRFAGRNVPVTLKDGSEHVEELDTLIWTGNDQESGKPVALYSFVSKPVADLDDEIPF
jgi:hypothetical protein